MRVIVAIVVVAVTQLASAQELHTFSNGEVADAEKINENFEAINAQVREAQTARSLYINGNRVGVVVLELSSNEEIFAVTSKGFTAAFYGDFTLLQPTRGIDSYFITEDCTGTAYAWPSSASFPMKLGGVTGHIGRDQEGNWVYVDYSHSATGLQLKTAYYFDGDGFVCYTLGDTDTRESFVVPILNNSPSVTGFSLESQVTSYEDYELRY